MSDNTFAPISDRICKHMNEDHADAVVLYAKIFGDCPEATSAEMLSIDAQGMNLAVKVKEEKEESVPIRVPFERDLKDAEDAHHTLIDMLKQAKQNLK